jgi:hypothetical protein
VTLHVIEALQEISDVHLDITAIVGASNPHRVSLLQREFLAVPARSPDVPATARRVLINSERRVQVAIP